MRASVIVALAVVLGGTAWGIAQIDHDAMDHGSHTSGMRHGSGPASRSPNDETRVLTEPGQGAFAALAEIVRVLEADPGTDWSKVDLSGLRVHLRDMDRLISDAVVTTAALADGLRMTVTGDAETIATVRRMVPAHAAELSKDERWQIEVDKRDDGAVLTVTSDDPAVAGRIRGLGFFGLMASQDHHREHHMMMARGVGLHAH